MGGETANRIELMKPPLGPRERLHVLKHDDLFAVFDAWGDFYGSLHQVGPSIGADGLVPGRYPASCPGLPLEFPALSQSY